MIIETHVTPTSRCPLCGSELDRATGGDTAPEPGSLSVCVDCTGVLKYAEDMRLVALTPAEFESLPEDDKRELLLARRVVLRIQGRADRETRQ